MSQDTAIVDPLIAKTVAEINSYHDKKNQFFVHAKADEKGRLMYQVLRDSSITNKQRQLYYGAFTGTVVFLQGYLSATEWWALQSLVD